MKFSSVILGVCALALSAIQAGRADETRPVRAEAFKPQGARYEVEVPDTLDLAERGRLAVHGLTSFLNPHARYAPFGHTFLNGNPPYLGNMPGGPPNWGKIAEDLLFARVMSGSEENLAIDPQMFEGMLASDWMKVNPVAPTPVSRAMLALMALYQLDPNSELKARLDAMAADHIAGAKVDGPIEAHYNDAPPDESESRLGTLGGWFPVFIQGSAIRPMARWGALSGQPIYTDFAAKLGLHLMGAQYWIPETPPKAVAAEDHAQFRGHSHSFTAALMGLIWYGAETNDPRVKEFVREGYEYMRTFGLSRIGLYGEGCTTGDMTYLALKLSDLGVGDYWDDADQYVRNQLAELQLTDEALMRRVGETMPKGRGKWDEAKGPLDPMTESSDDMPGRVIGTFLSDSTHPTLIPDHSYMFTICCTGNCTPAMYAAWEAIVRCTDGAAQVNLLLNRASPWLDVDSYLPYEGKVVMRNKTARKLSVRIPRWVDKRAVKSEIDGKAASPFWAGQYLVFDSLGGKERVTITFPMVESVEKYTLKWKQSMFWQESIDPGKSWEADKPPTQYTLRMRGNTLVDITPRDEGIGYPLYLHRAIAEPHAPMKKVERYLPPVVLSW